MNNYYIIQSSIFHQHSVSIGDIKDQFLGNFSHLELKGACIMNEYFSIFFFLVVFVRGEEE